MKLCRAENRKRHTALRDQPLRLELALVVAKRNAIDATDRDIEQVLHAGRSRDLHETLRPLHVNRLRVPRIAGEMHDGIDIYDRLGQPRSRCQIADNIRHLEVESCSLDPTQDGYGVPGG